MQAKTCRDILLTGISVFVLSAAIPTGLAVAAEEESGLPSQEELQSMAAATASANYTGNAEQKPPMPTQSGEIPVGVQGAGATTGMIPGVMGPEQPEPEIVYQYDKKAVEGFYGVELPKRLFNNVPSDW